LAAGQAVAFTLIDDSAFTAKFIDTQDLLWTKLNAGAASYAQPFIDDHDFIHR
jgi:hypothetical protein